MPKFIPWADPPAGTGDRRHGTRGGKAKQLKPRRNYNSGWKEFETFKRSVVEKELGAPRRRPDCFLRLSCQKRKKHGELCFYKKTKRAVDVPDVV